MENQNQKQNQAQKKSVGSNVLIIILILIILATSAFGIFAWARYQTSVEGEGTAQVAQWNFKVTGNGTQTEQVSFLMTRTDNNNTVATGTIAPGTYGEIPIEIDVTGTQTDLVYTITGSTVNMPRNLKLYYDEARTQEMVVVGQKFSKGNYLKVADIGEGTKILSETIYWEWPFETGDTESVININNETDTEDMGKTMTMMLTVEGKQLNGAPTLADLAQVGDYVNYNASSAGEYTFAPEECLEGVQLSDTISTNDMFDSAAKSQWRVLNVNRQTKEVELVAVESTTQLLESAGIDKTFENMADNLNKIGAIYGNGNGAVSGRSIVQADIEQYSIYDPYTYKNSEIGIFYGGTKTYNSGTFYKEIKDENGKIVYEKNKVTASADNIITVTQTHYGYTANYRFKNLDIYNMLFKKTINNDEYKAAYWLATPAAKVNGSNVDYTMSDVNNGVKGSTGVYNTSKQEYTHYLRSILPVVTLETNIQTTGKVNDVWQLKVNN